jgi:hypothetical protein
VAASRSSRSATASAASSGRTPARHKGPAVTLDPEQRSRLLAAKLRALVVAHLGDTGEAPAGGEVAPGPDLALGTFPGGATARAGERGWVLLDERADTALGRALVWAGRESVTTLDLLVEDPAVAGVLARRATAFADTPRVWLVEGRSLVAVEPAAVPAPVEPPAVARELVGLLHDAGVEVVTEHGEIRGEVLGLEVARVVVDTDDHGAASAARVEVGVGRHDREAFAMLHGDIPTPDALSKVIDKVRLHRRPDAEAHPLRRMAAERWLRSTLIEAPAVVGAAQLQAAEPTVARDSLKDVVPAIALGADESGGPVVVACSVGIDLDLVPAAADARLVHAPDARLVIVVPERDDHPVTRRLAAALRDPATIVTVPSDWPRVGVRPSGAA